MIKKLIFFGLFVLVFSHFGCMKAITLSPLYKGDTVNIGLEGNAVLINNNSSALYLINDGTGVQGTDTTGYFYFLYDVGINDTGFGFTLNLHGDTAITAPNGHILQVEFIGCKWEIESEPDYSFSPPGTYFYWVPYSATLFVKWQN